MEKSESILLTLLLVVFLLGVLLISWSCVSTELGWMGIVVFLPVYAIGSVLFVGLFAIEVKLK